MGLILDTSFVVAAEREARRGQGGRTQPFLERHLGDSFFITFTVAGELACGQSATTRRDWELLCRPYPILPWSIEISWHYGDAYRALSSKGLLIGGNDLWIAATALAHGHGVVTSNAAEFGRVPGLRVLSF
jgi:tRNA(fMet)-specific endonuclease VapC